MSRKVTFPLGVVSFRGTRVNPMKRALLAAALLAIGTAMACADPTDLSNGVLIAHYEPAIVWSEYPPSEGWCEYYFDGFGISDCELQNPSVPNAGNVIWYVLAQWWEPKTWCLAEFGFGDYDRSLFVFMANGACTPGANLEITTGFWPGPNSGTAVTATDIPWSGNFVPFYYFLGYGYGDRFGQIPFAPDPIAVPFAGFANCLTPPEAFEATCLPALGVGMPGAECCASVHPPDSPCCVGEDCIIVNEIECVEFGGVWYPDILDCDPNPCTPSPTDNTSWGKIKTIYR